jgi:hypothetical protein
MSESEDKLHRLIHSLDKSEKGFIKKFAALHVKEDANGVRLFDIYNSVRIYNKVKIEKLVKKEKFANHLPKTKNYLFELILKALRNYYSEKKEIYNLKTQIQNADILKDKGLYKEALSIIKRTKKIGLEKEIYYPLVEALIIERQIWPSYQINPQETAILSKLNREEEKHLKYMDEAVVFFTNACFKAFYFAHLMGRGDREATLNDFDKMVNSADYQRLLFLSSKKIKTLHQIITTYHHYIKEEKDLFIQEGEILLELCINKNKRPGFSNEIIVGFFTNLGVAASRFYHAGLFVKCINVLKKLKEEMSDTESHAFILAESCLSDLTCSHHLFSTDFEAALKICEAYLKKEVIKDDAINDNLVVLYINKSLIHFMLEQFPEAIKALNAIELYTQKHTTPYVDSEFYLIKILSHLEMGNAEAAFYMAKSYKNFIEKESLNFFQRKALVDVIVKNPMAEKREIAKLVSNKFLEENIPTDKCWDQYLLDINIWCQCAIKNISINQEYKKEYRKLYQ